jgi:hypothetical protein
MRYVLALLAAVNAWGVMPASSEECEPGLSLASLDNTYTAGSTYTVGSAQLRLESRGLSSGPPVSNGPSLGLSGIISCAEGS